MKKENLETPSTQNQNQLIEDLFEDFKLLVKFKVNEKVKKRMLKELLEATPNSWRIVGITHEALDLFAKNDFKRKDHSKKNLPIQRAHLVDRKDWYQELLDRQWNNSQEWLIFIEKNDETRLALSTQNRHILTYLHHDIPNSEGAFKSKVITWTHGLKEEKILRDLYEQIADS